MQKVHKKYNHLGEDQRNTLYRHYNAGIGIKRIADILGLHRSTIYREFKRNKHLEHEQYLPDHAQILSFKRRNRQGSKIQGSKQLQQYIKDGLAMQQSPEVIAGRLELESSKQIISHESIYKWIYNEAKDLELYKKLLRSKRCRGKRPSKKSQSKIPHRVSIHDRPEHPVDEIGHWEGDTIHFSKTKSSIVTVYDKATKITLGAKMTSRTTEETMDNLMTIFNKLPHELRRSITFDNGSEFTNHEALNANFSMSTFFCDPQSPWQKGGVENTNGIVRRYIPKGAREEDYSAAQVQQIFHWMNTTPRKSLNYKTPYEMLLTKLTGKDDTFPLFNLNVALRL